jgi:esterase/lipase superfamily enzyme
MNWIVSKRDGLFGQGLGRSGERNCRVRVALSRATKLALNRELREYLALQKTKIKRRQLAGRIHLKEVFMERRITTWFSQNLSAEMPLVAYGHAGQPLLMLPTAAADYLEYERFHLVDAIRPLIESGKIRAYSINSVNKYSLLNEKMPPNLKAELLTRFDRYITDEVLPLIRNDAGQDARPLTTGASLGAFLAANAYFKHPDLLRGMIALSGSYDVRSYFKGFYDDNVYFNNPADYLPNLDDDHYLPILKKADAIYIVSGQGAYEAPERSRHLSDILKAKGIPHTLDLWGADVNHDWPWWRKMLPHTLDRILG